ncbi:MAG: DUF2399 domain-containing protein [Clostridia bacterium]|nr:DUF2399 domain-containing protein [Clostridia bacterium]
MRNNGFAAPEALSEWQAGVLSLMLDSYEGSRTYFGENRVNQHFAVDPEKVMPGYRDDFTDPDEIAAFTEDMRSLEEKGLIRIARRPGSTEIDRLYPVKEALPEYYALLGRTEKRDVLSAQRAMYTEYLGRHPVLDAYCREQLRLLEKNRKPRNPEDETLLPLLLRILENREDLLERELSILFFSDSKMFEKSYRHAVCSVLKTYGGHERLLEDVSDAREQEQLLLAEYRVFPNPNYVYLKGTAELTLRDGQTLRVLPGYPMGISSLVLDSLQEISIQESTVMTVENVTSFHRLQQPDTFFVFLSGYHNTAKQALIRMLFRDNPDKFYLHFGDLDPDGFGILRHLREGTGVPFRPYRMDAETLRQFVDYGKPLTENDRKTLRHLLDKGEATEALQEMERLGKKVEQEIVSLHLMNGDG